MSRRIRRLALYALLGALVLFVGLAAFLRFEPVTISSPRMLADFALGRGIDPPTAEQIEARLQVAPGFSLQAYSSDVPLARVMVVTSSGDVIVSRTRLGIVSILDRDRDGDGRADGVRTLFENLDGPHGLALHQGWLYVAEKTAVGRVRFDAARGSVTGAYEHVLTGLTSDGFHQTKSIGFGPDGWLYLTQGSTCNACIENDERRAAMMRMQPDGSRAEIVATGLRNSVGFDWAPWDGALYATENGRDLLGDDFPPDELNRIEPGGFYGWPYFNGAGVPDPDVSPAPGTQPPSSTPPVHEFRPHNAPLGVHFLRVAGARAGYERTALVALHGSWNRRAPDGYKVVALHWMADGSIVERDFLTGFIGPDGVIGRPAFVAEGPDGALYVSDDYAGVVYRIVAR